MDIFIVSFTRYFSIIVYYNVFNLTKPGSRSANDIMSYFFINHWFTFPSILATWIYLSLLVFFLCATNLVTVLW